MGWREEGEHIIIEQSSSFSIVRSIEMVYISELELSEMMERFRGLEPLVEMSV